MHVLAVNRAEGNPRTGPVVQAPGKDDKVRVFGNGIDARVRTHGCRFTALAVVIRDGRPADGVHMEPHAQTLCDNIHPLSALRGAVAHDARLYAQERGVHDVLMVSFKSVRHIIAWIVRILQDQHVGIITNAELHILGALRHREYPVVVKILGNIAKVRAVLGAQKGILRSDDTIIGRIIQDIPVSGFYLDDVCRTPAL